MRDLGNLPPQLSTLSVALSELLLCSLLPPPLAITMCVGISVDDDAPPLAEPSDERCRSAA